ncbi:hypothetical protein GCM10020295_61420 [Streptomyces cinereospinus]
MISLWSAVRRRAVRRPQAPVMYALITVCCLIFLIGPASGLGPAYGLGDELLAAQRAYFRHWGVVPAELFEGSPGPSSPRPRPSSCTAAGSTCSATCSSSTSSA